MATATKSTATKKASSARRNTAKAKAKPKSKPKRKPTLKTHLAKLSGKLALQGTAAVGRRALDSLTDAGRSAVETVRERTGAPHLPNVRRLPIQRSIDIAVPLEVAWDEWMALEFLPEGTHRVEEIERDGDGRLVGTLGGVLSGDWEAEVLDERENESFAWRSIEGSDCAGLVTFHALSERLTRIELQLDVVPSGVGEAAALALHLADRRAETELRLFKARLETISPDEYPEEEE